MIKYILAFCVVSFFAQQLMAEQLSEQLLDRHKLIERSLELSRSQDEVDADLQQLVIEETDEKILDKLEEVNSVMREVTDLLENTKIDGATIAAETDVIEKIFEIMKNKSCNNKSSQSMENLLEEMKKNEDKCEGKDKKEGEGAKEGEGTKEGEGKEGKKNGKGGKSPGGGGTGNGTLSGTSKMTEGEIAGNEVKRRLPKTTGGSITDLPEEFRSMLDAYNREAEKNTK